MQHLICTQWISFIEGWAYLVKQDKSFALEESMEWLIINFFWGNISSQKTTWLCLRFAEATCVCLGRHSNTVLSRNFFQLTSKMRCVDSLIVDRRRSCHTTFSFFRLKLKNFLSFFDFLLSLLWLFKLLLLFGVSAMSKSDPESVVSTSSTDASSTSSSVVLSS